MKCAMVWYVLKLEAKPWCPPFTPVCQMNDAMHQELRKWARLGSKCLLWYRIPTHITWPLTSRAVQPKQIICIVCIMWLSFFFFFSKHRTICTLESGKCETIMQHFYIHLPLDSCLPTQLSAWHIIPWWVWWVVFLLQWHRLGFCVLMYCNLL